MPATTSPSHSAGSADRPRPASCASGPSAREVLVKEHPETPDYRAGLAENCLNRGLARRDLGDPAGAAADLRRATGMCEALESRTD